MAGHSCNDDLVEDFIDTGERTRGVFAQIIESNEILAGTAQGEECNVQNHGSMISFSVAIDERDYSCWSEDGPADGEDRDPLFRLFATGAASNK